MYQAHVTEVQFQDSARNSDKFYRCYRLWDDTGDHRVVFQWGRRGAKGQSSVQVCASQREATNLVVRKLDEKMSKGYYRVYQNELAAVSPDIMHLAGLNTSVHLAASQRPQDPFVRLAVDVDTCRRLAMGDQADVVRAVTLRQDLHTQLDALRTAVSNSEGQIELVDMLLSAKV